MRGLIAVLVCVGFALGHPAYQAKIPNGANVPNPCLPGTIWLAVGHYDPNHHTQLKNPFALDFSANLHKWDVALCQKDSDHDGMTNGEELGDPTCVWYEGGPAPTDSPKGHPGLCEPIGSCPLDSFSCGCHGHSCVGK